jgi:hypothetical protein
MQLCSHEFVIGLHVHTTANECRVKVKDGLVV